MRVRTLIGVIIMILGVLAIVYAAFLLVQDAPNANSTNIPRIVGYDAIIALAGAVAFIMGVVIQGFRNIFALILHLIAIIPYYLAIAKVQTLGQQGIGDWPTYLTKTELYWPAAIILGIIGVILNRVGRKKATPPQTQPTQPTAPPPK